MKIRENEIREIVREEIRSLLEANPYHDSEGKLSGPDTGNVYSITNKASQKYGNEAKKGKLGANKRLGYKFGMTKCGRRAMSGEDQPATYSCKDYPRKYWDKLTEEMVLASVDVPDATINDAGVACFNVREMLRVLQSHEERLNEADGDQLATACRRAGFSTFKDILASMNSMSLASAGELYKKP